MQVALDKSVGQMHKCKCNLESNMNTFCSSHWSSQNFWLGRWNMLNKHLACKSEG